MNKQSHNFKTGIAGARKGFRIAASMLLTMAAGLLSFSCRDELGISPDDNNVTQVEIPAGTKFYSYIRLLPVDGVPSRATDNYGENNYPADFVPGDAEKESKIDNMLVIFYDEEGKSITYSEVNSLKEIKNEDEFGGEGSRLAKDEDGDNVVVEELGYNVLIPIEAEIAEPLLVANPEKIIASYFVILNYNKELFEALSEEVPNSAIQETTRKFKDLSEVNKVVVTSHRLSRDGKDLGFLMTTAGHFDSEGKYQWYDVAPDENSVIYRKTSDAKAHPITVYVERLAVRTDFQINEKNIDKIPVYHNETDVYDLIFTPDYWVLEGLESTSYLPKKMDVAKKSEYSSKNDYHSDFADWIDYNYNRVFWAKSPTFSGGTYPSKGDETTGLSLSYLTFKDIAVDSRKLEEATIEGEKLLTGTLYAMEHTFEASELNNTANPYAVPTSVVLRGRYTAKLSDPGTDERDKDGNPTQTTAPKTLDLTKGFYIRTVDAERNEPGKNYEYHLYLEGTTDRADELYEAMLAEQYMIWGYDEEKQEYYPVKDGNKESVIFGIVNTQQRLDISTTPVAASNTYTLQIDKDKLGSYEVYLKTEKNKEREPIKITADNVAEANQALQQQLGYAQRYYQGYAFFYAPITHYSGVYDPFKTTGYTGLFNYKQSTGDDGGYETNELGNYMVNHKTSDFGFVRNHIYKMKISGISNLGYGIPDENVIPLPEPRLDKKQYIFDLELQILPWNIYEYNFDI